MMKPDPQQLKQDLQQFTGTEYWHRHPLNPNCLYTDGVEFWADQVGGYWLLDILATEFFDLMVNEGFLSITLKVKDGRAALVIEDGNYKNLATKHIDFTDCPVGEWEFFMSDSVILLRSEY